MTAIPEVGLARAVAAANRFTSAWGARHGSGVTALSGIGAWVLLAALEGGAAGGARDELEAAVGLPPTEALAAVRLVVELADTSPAVNAALAVWAHAAAPLEAAWRAALPADVVGTITGDHAADQAAMDQWVVERTAGELDHLPVAVDGETLVVLASALAVRTRWVKQFDPGPVRFTEGPWSGAGGFVGLRALLDDVDLVRVADSPAGPLTLLRVPGRDDVDVTVALGPAEAAPGAVLAAAVDAGGGPEPAGVAGSALAEGSPGPGLSVSTVTSSHPSNMLWVDTVAFDVVATHDLLADAAAFGLATAATVQPGHFPGVSSFPLAVGQARQDVTARFTQEGFIAAAVTAIAMMAGAAFRPAEFEVRRISVTIDRPFAFVATHRPTGLVLVAGWIDREALLPESSIGDPTF